MDERRRAAIIAPYLNNTAGPDNYQDLGILRFGKDFFPEKFSNDFSIMHYQMSLLLLEMYMPHLTRRIERQRYLLCHREGSKSTIGSDLFPTYLLYMKGYSPYIRFDNKIVKLPPINEKFIVVTSETSTRAEQFVTDIRNTVELRGDLAEIFGEKNPRLIETDEDDRTKGNLWRKNAFITSDGTVVWGLGAGQRIRGIKVNASRPTLIIVDDMYSRHNTKTEQTREHLNYWFYSELSNSADSVSGKMLWLGTLVHPDTVITKFKKDEDWQGVERPIISHDELALALDKWKKYNGRDTVPPKDLCKKWQKEFKTLSWAARHDLWYILKLYKTARDNDDYDYFYQEYMNIPKAPELEEVHVESFIETPLTIYRSNDYNMEVQYLEFEFEGIPYRGELVLCIGVDPAVSTSQHADETAIYVAGYVRAFPYFPGMDTETIMKHPGRVFPVIAHLEAGRYAIHEHKERKGLAETLIKLCRRYKISYVSIEAMGQQKAIVDEVRRTFYEENITVPIMEEYTNQKKEERINSVILSIIQRYKFVICEPNVMIVKKLFNQLLMLGITDHDDHPDAWAIAMKNIQPPQKRVIYQPLESRSIPERQLSRDADSLEWLFR